MNKPVTRTTITCLLLALAGTVHAGTIKKCQDESGQWHYGDSAAAACAKSKVIEMSGSGQTRKVIDAPPSASDLDDFRKKKLAEEEAKRKAIEQKKHDQTLLSTYAHEDDIIYARDRQLAELENSIVSGEQTLNSLRAVLGRMRQQATEEKESKGEVSQDTQKNLKHSESQVNRHAANLDQKKKEKEELRQKFERDLARYRELKTPKVPVSDEAKPAGDG